MSFFNNQGKKKYLRYSAAFSLILLLFPLACHAVSAAEIANEIVGAIAGWVVGALGSAASLIISGIVSVAPYNNFIGNAQIIAAWKIVRDICNMFFVLILLAIAFATILRIESYNMKKWLPKLLIMAVLINFSKTICGIMIDFSQVIMLTFVNTFAGGGQFFSLAELKSAISQRVVSSGQTAAVVGGSQQNAASTLNSQMSASNVIVGYLLAIVFMLVGCIALVSILIAFVMRIIMLWILVALSPLAFLLSAFPSGTSYANKYWGELTKYLINGPVLAFFVWLALSVTSNFSSMGMTTTGLQAGVTQILSDTVFIKFIMGIGFLAGGLAMSAQIGGVGAAWGANTMKSLQNKGVSGVKRAAKGTVKGVTKGTVAGLDWANRKVATKTGVDLNMSRNFAKVKSSFERTKQKDLTKIEQSAGRNLKKGGVRGFVTGISSSGWGDEYLRGFMGADGVKQMVFGGEKKNAKREEKRSEYAKQAEVARGKMENSGSELKKISEEIENDEKMKAEDHPSYSESDHNFRLHRRAEIEKEISEAGQDKDRYSELEREQAHELAKYDIGNYHGTQAWKQQINNESKNIDSNNEDELVIQFDNAMEHNNAPLAAAIARALARIGGMNTLLNKSGYAASAGYTKEEAKNVAPDVYKKTRGFNDFIRDNFQGKLGMDEQTALSLQSDLSSLGETARHEYMSDVVSYRADGKYVQRSEDNLSAVKFANKSKKEPEGKIRNNTRFGWGNEDVDGNFYWDTAGLADFTANITTITKEMDGKRFNKSAAKSIAASDEAIQRLKQKLTAVYGNGDVIVWKDKNISVDKFVENLKNYAAAYTKENQAKLLQV